MIAFQNLHGPAAHDVFAAETFHEGGYLFPVFGPRFLPSDLYLGDEIGGHFVPPFCVRSQCKGTTHRIKRDQWGSKGTSTPARVGTKKEHCRTRTNSVHYA